jgi:hypothetical protein
MNKMCISARSHAAWGAFLIAVTHVAEHLSVKYWVILMGGSLFDQAIDFLGISADDLMNCGSVCPLPLRAQPTNGINRKVRAAKGVAIAYFIDAHLAVT